MRHDYDRLSDLGQEQARALGDYLGREKILFSAVVSGGLRRQQETAAGIAAGIKAAGGHCPEVFVDEQWNEFDLDAVYRGIAPQLLQVSSEFKVDYEELLAEIERGGDSIHRRWTRADTAMVRAWILGEHRFDGESWNDFQARIHSALGSLPAPETEGPVAVATSATPAAICIGLALNLEPKYIMRIAGATLNASFSVLDRRSEGLHLLAYNAVPHLTEAGLRTYR